ncbi:MAG: hypothetical protein ACOYYS_28015 [Chloroflexota bacterium]
MIFILPISGLFDMLRLSCFYLLLISIFASMLGGLSACVMAPVPTEILPPSLTAIPTGTETATPTVIWFPSTPTHTLQPTYTPGPPTPDLRAGIGALIFADDFRDPFLWALSRTTNTSAAFGKGVLTLAIQDARAYVSSTRNQPILDNFYAEIAVDPSLCRGQDEYGLIVRQASPGDFYRFSMSCEGEVRLDRVLHGQASTPYPWQPGGSPGTARLGVWAVGKEMRFFANGAHQFTLNDPSISSGLLGVFARSTGKNALTVNFSDLAVWEIDR